MTAIISALLIVLAEFAITSWSLGGAGDGAWDGWADYRCDKV